MKSRYRGPLRPQEEYKDWLQEGYKADSWSRDQSKDPSIYLSPGSIVYYYNFIHTQGYPFDLENLTQSVDLQDNPNNTIYTLNG